MTNNLNIITTWDECAERYSETKTYQMKKLNAELGSRYTLTKRSKWRRAVEKIPMTVYDYLITECLPAAIELEGGAMPHAIKNKIRLVMRLRPPKKNNRRNENES